MEYPTAQDIERAAAVANLTLSEVFDAAKVGRESFYRERRGDGKMLPRTALRLQSAVERLAERSA